MKKIKLSAAVLYSKKKVKFSELSLENYVTTDNLLPDKAGVAIATNLPPRGESFPRYDAGDILISNIRPYLKKIWFAKRTGACSSDVLVLSANKDFDPRFVYYSIFKDDFFEHVMKGAKGTKMPRGDKNQIMEFQIPDFTPAIQDKVATMLAAIDEKIELNKKVNDNLEQMAKALYDYWFVQFDFPDKSGKPYKSSGGKMVSDKSLKINIPAEWQVQTLDNILTLEYGKPLKKEGRSNSGYPVYGSNGIVGYHKHFIAEGPGIVVGRKGSAGEIIRTNECFYPIDTAYYILDRLGVKSLSFHYQLLRVCDLKKIESSSAVPGLNRNTVYAIKTIVPPIALIHHYNEYADALYHKIDINTKQNNQLVNLRDWLLPMLMNGQVKIA